jgi:hypothetical protein
VLAWLAAVAAVWSGDVAAPVVPLGASDDPDRPVVSSPYLRTTLEIALVLAGGTVWYLREAEQEKWSRGLEWRSWKRKMLGTSDIVFDADRFNTNAAAHAVAGVAYYHIARGNGLGPGQSFLATFLASTFWEYFVEIPEHPSLNDLILTPAAGAVIGEATYRLGRYFARTGPGTAPCVGAVLFAPVAALNDRPVCGSRGNIIPWALLGLEMGIGRAVFDGDAVRDELVLALSSEIITLRAYERPGDGHLPVSPGQFSALYADGRFGAGRVDGLWFHAGTVWGGRYDRNFYRLRSDDTDVPSFVGPARGWGLLSGFGSSFDYRLRDLPQVHDRIASVGLAGPMLQFSARSSVLLRASFTLQYAFAIVGSLAYRAEPNSLVGQNIKMSLRDAAYYYAHGVVSAANLMLDLGPVGFSADARGGWYWSIDSADPAQTNISRNVTLHDSRIYLSAAMWSRPVSAFRFGLGVEHVRRASYMLDAGVFGTEVDVLLTTAIGF